MLINKLSPYVCLFNILYWSFTGVVPGCIGKCDSSPCLNNGTCHERYDGYSCDCRWTAFKGPICADGLYN